MKDNNCQCFYTFPFRFCEDYFQSIPGRTDITGREWIDEAEYGTLIEHHSLQDIVVYPFDKIPNTQDMTIEDFNNSSIKDFNGFIIEKKEPIKALPLPKYLTLKDYLKDNPPKERWDKNEK